MDRQEKRHYQQLNAAHRYSHTRTSSGDPALQEDALRMIEQEIEQRRPEFRQRADHLVRLAIAEEAVSTAQSIGAPSSIATRLEDRLLKAKMELRMVMIQSPGPDDEELLQAYEAVVKALADLPASDDPQSEPTVTSD